MYIWRDELLRKAAAQPAGFWVRDILDPNYTQAERNALQRATRGLAAQGYIKIERKYSRGHGTLWVTKGSKTFDVQPPKYILVRLRHDASHPPKLSDNALETTA